MTITSAREASPHLKVDKRVKFWTPDVDTRIIRSTNVTVRMQGREGRVYLVGAHEGEKPLPVTRVDWVEWIAGTDQVTRYCIAGKVKDLRTQETVSV